MQEEGGPSVLGGKLDQLRQALERRLEALGPAAERRRRLEAVGTIRRIRPRLPAGQRWAGADGSRVLVGDPYPYVVEFYRALARDTQGGEVRLERVRSPLADPEVEDREEGRRQALARLELEAARRLVEERRPDVLLLDGGLLSFAAQGGEAWEALVQAADDAGTLVAGVIEDIATRELGGRIGLGIAAHDREVLHDVLQPGEALIVGPEAGIKRGLATAFVRWGVHPRPTAVDVREKDAGRLGELLDAMAPLVPPEGRGIPLWLDLIDHDVRIRAEEAERLLEARLGPGLYHAWLRPLRQQRAL